LSLDNPNIYERSIDEYAEAWRELKALEKQLEILEDQISTSKHQLRLKWGVVQQHIINGGIKPGVYKINPRNSSYAHGVVLDKEVDFPPILDMFR
jgi:hypothetical protein